MSHSKSVIVSGGTYGIGRGIVVELAQRGWSVVGFGLDSRQPGSSAEGGVEGTRRALADAGLTGEVLEADVSRTLDVERVMEHTLSCFGGIHGAVNNAAIRPTGSILETDEATFDRVVAVNLKGQFLLCKAAIAHMRHAGGGSIVNIGSGAGWGKAGLLAYGASKGGVFALSSALAYDHLMDRIRINVVVPGPQTASGMVEIMADQGPLPKVATASGRGNQPRDIANAVAFLLSDDAEQISGTVLDVGAFSHQGGVGQPRA
ncbi:MAG: 3-alpha-(or 20-beta)-hydroxysteroid dehydrogenase [Alphaproteobacteria bacterium MarineAlpha4_Bin2]|nr:MAG: 3-alpha-(or 20-beta)-hydroxysteroid dehydrogenase [Alphaproteobacteria bacterium MarineAlpha4_Bin2]